MLQAELCKTLPADMQATQSDLAYTLLAAYCIEATDLQGR